MNMIKTIYKTYRISVMALALRMRVSHEAFRSEAQAAVVSWSLKVILRMRWVITQNLGEIRKNERISLDLIFEQSGKVNLSRLETDPEFKGQKQSCNKDKTLVGIVVLYEKFDGQKKRREL